MLTTQKKSRIDNPNPLPEIGEQSWLVTESELLFPYSDDDIRDLKKYLSQISDRIDMTIEPREGKLKAELKQLKKIKKDIEWRLRLNGV